MTIGATQANLNPAFINVICLCHIIQDIDFLSNIPIMMLKFQNNFVPVRRGGAITMSSILLPTLSWSALWDNHPFKEWPCDKAIFGNQCAARMGVALQKSGADLSSFRGARCWLKHTPRHILRAQELADWLRTQTELAGKVKIYKKVTWEEFKNKRGILFIQNLTGAGGLDHIDLWSGSSLKKGAKTWISACEQVWFWDLWPCIAKAEAGSVPVYSEADVESPYLRWVTSDLPVEVVKVEENWVTVNMTKYEDQDRVGSEEGFIERRSIVFPDESVPASRKGVVTVRSLNIRRDHSTSSAKVGALRQREEVTILETWTDGKDTWAKLAADRWAAMVSNGETLIEERL